MKKKRNDDKIGESDSRHIRWLNLAVKNAYKSQFYQYKHGAVLIKGGRVLSLGFNHFKKGCLFNLVYEERLFHAEADVLSKCNIKQIKNAVLYVAGINRTGIINSKPCPYCQEMIAKYPLKAVIYFNEFKRVSIL